MQSAAPRTRARRAARTPALETGSAGREADRRDQSEHAGLLLIRPVPVEWAIQLPVWAFTERLAIVRADLTFERGAGDVFVAGFAVDVEELLPPHGLGAFGRVLVGDRLGCDLGRFAFGGLSFLGQIVLLEPVDQFRLVPRLR